MKKIIICILFLLFPITVYASNVDYDIENFLIEAEVLEDGNMKVRELIVLDGTFNGYIRDIVYKNNKLVSNKTIDYEKDAELNEIIGEYYDVLSEYIRSHNFRGFFQTRLFI